MRKAAQTAAAPREQVVGGGYGVHSGHQSRRVLLSHNIQPFNLPAPHDPTAVGATKSSLKFQLRCTWNRGSLRSYSLRSHFHATTKKSKARKYLLVVSSHEIPSPPYPFRGLHVRRCFAFRVLAVLLFH